ncbi:MAG: hypothetical protein ACRCXT_02380 [Paraclostridium sp.]
MRKQLRSFRSVRKSGIRINKKMTEKYPKENRKPNEECNMIDEYFHILADSIDECVNLFMDDSIRIIRKPKRNKFVTRKYL